MFVGTRQPHASAVIENLEGRRLLSGDFDTVRAVPYSLEFISGADGLVDANGLGTGFNYTQNNRLRNDYQPSLLNVNAKAGVLEVTASGSNYNGDNTLVNGLGVTFNASATSWFVTATLKGPFNAFNGDSEQAGVMLGPDQNNYVKTVLLYTPSGLVVQFTDEQGASTGQVHTVSGLVTPKDAASASSIELRLTGDPGTGQIFGSYRLNGSGSFVRVPGTLTVTGTQKTRFFSPVGRALILAGSKDAAGPVTAEFDRFEIAPASTTPTPPPPPPPTPPPPTPPPPPGATSPSVRDVTPAHNATNVRRDAFVLGNLNLFNGGLNSATVNTTTVRLFRTSDGAAVPGLARTSGGGDNITYTPTGLLDANTRYTFMVTSAVKDVSGASMTPFTSNFTTGTTGGPSTTPTPVQFTKVSLGTATGKEFTGVVVGPDGRLYASTYDGEIHRWPIAGDGSLGAREVISTVRSRNGGSRTITGLAFDRSATSGNLIVYVTHTAYTAIDSYEGADYTGKVSRLSGPSLETYQDYVVRLPRSVRDHLTNQPVVGPDGALYFVQASNTSMGAADPVWRYRSEHLLNAALLRLDLNAVAARISRGQGPVDASGSYNPYASGAPLAIYASGIRNAYDLVFHRSGGLFVPVNGSAAGGNTPRSSNTGRRPPTGAPYSGPFVPGYTNVPFAAVDTLIEVDQHRYYGHPNPSRGEFVYNGGNPTSAANPYEMSRYPVGVQPDARWEQPVFNFGTSRAPAGIIEYKSNTFGGALAGKLLVVRYSAGDDIIVLSPSGESISGAAQADLPGMTGFNDPVDLIEYHSANAADPRNGLIYVAEFGGRKITLLRPQGTTTTPPPPPPPPGTNPGTTGSLTVTNLDGVPFDDRLVFNRIHVQPPRPRFDSAVGRHTAPPRNVVHDTATVKLGNSGSRAFTISSMTLSSGWSFVSRPANGTVIRPGTSVNVTLKFTQSSKPASSGNQTMDASGRAAAFAASMTGSLVINTTDAAAPTRTIQLAGWWQNENEANQEPSLPTLVNRLLGYRTTVLHSGQALNAGGRVQAVGEEVLSAYWRRADSTRPVTVRQLAAYRTQGYGTTLRWHDQGSTATRTLYMNNANEAQSLLPKVGTSAAMASFSPAGAFGFRIDNEWSDPTKNLQERSGGGYGHHVRFWPAEDRQGNRIPNTWLMTMDYQGVNYDYQDNLYLVTNVFPSGGRPDTSAPPPALPPPPPPTTGMAVTSLTLYNAATNAPIGPFTSGMHLDLGGGRTYSVRANTSGTTGSVRFTLNGTHIKYESAAPYTIAGDRNGDYDAWIVPAGAHTLTVTPFSGTAGTGTAGQAFTMTFTAGGANGVTGSPPTSMAPSPTTSGGIGSLSGANIGGGSGAASAAGAGAFIVSGRGADVHGGTGTDQFHFARQSRTGDFDIKVRVASLSNTHAFAKAGLMARADTAAGSRSVSILTTPGSNGFRFGVRSATGAVNTLKPGAAATFPNVWVRLRRAGNVFTGYSSRDGVNWTTLGSTVLSLPTTIEFGLAVASHTTSTTATAQFRDLDEV